jgi:uncharacterized protein
MRAMSSSAPDALDEARLRMQALREALAPPGGNAPRLIETHISWILLGDTLAYKLKKPLALPFIDMHTLAARQHACAEELRLNRRLAPALYLAVDEVRQTAAGPRLGGEGPLLDVAVRMRRFPDGALWSERVSAGTLAADEVEAMARRLARFHAEAPVAGEDTAWGSAAAHARVTQGLIAAMDARPADGWDWPALRRWLGNSLAALTPFWDERRTAGRVREGHGDLHLANLLQLDDGPAAFDAIDFDPALRWIDVLDDTAFTVMDLLAHGAPALAWRFLDAWLEASGDHAGLPALRFFLVCRALVRAQVMDLTPADRPGANLTAANYRALASTLAASADPRLAITHGLPGSGKSHAALRLVEEAGAIRLRSDVERKRLFGLTALEASRERAPQMYGADATRRTYARLTALADSALSAGWPVVVDAAFLQRDERDALAALAASRGLPWAIVDCQAALPVLQQRLRERQAAAQDASEADEAVLTRLAGVAQPLTPDEQSVALCVDAADPDSLARLAQRWQALQRPSLTPGTASSTGPA